MRFDRAFCRPQVMRDLFVASTLHDALKDLTLPWSQGGEESSQLVDLLKGGNAHAKFDEAIELYRQALAIDPKYGDAAHGLALCHKAKGDLDAAIEVTRQYVEQDPEDILAFTNLSMFYQKKGMIKEAEEAGAEARRLEWKRQLKEGVAGKK